MDLDECLDRYGIRPVGAQVEEIRTLLRELTEQERRDGEGDTELMRLCAFQLFKGGAMQDALLIWLAKRSSFDAGCSLDVELLLGRGLEETKSWLAAQGSDDAAAALAWVVECEAAGQFQGFSVEEFAAGNARFYAG